MRERREKRAAVRDAALEAYPVALDPHHTSLRSAPAHPDLAPDTVTGELVGVTGRVMTWPS